MIVCSPADAPWCGHCKALAPEYAKAAQALAEEESDIKLAKLDATVHDKVAQKFGVRGYPTLKFFRNGKDSEYGGGRTKDEIINWLKKKTGPPAAIVDSVEAAEKAIDGKDVVIVGFFKDQQSKDAKAFLDIASGIDEHPFVITSSDDVISKYEAADGKVIMLKTFDEKRHELEGAIEEENVKSFIAKYSLPLVVEFNQETAQKIFGGEIKAHLLMFLSKKSEDYAKHTEAASAVAKEQRGKVGADEWDRGHGGVADEGCVRLVHLISKSHTFPAFLGTVIIVNFNRGYVLILTFCL